MNGPIRLCIVNPHGYELFDPSGRATRVFGGAEVQLYYLSTGLAATGEFDVSMVVEQYGDVDGRHQGVRMLAVPPVGRAFARFRDRIPVPAPAYLRALRRADADIYLQRGGAVLTGDVATYCRTRGRAFAFMAAHDWDCDRRHQRGWQYLAGTYYLAGLRAADLVFAQSEHQRTLLRQHLDVDSIVQRTVYPAASRADVPRDHVLWVGRCLSWKRPLALLDLAAERPDQTFVMACPAYEGERALYDEVTRRAARLPNVDFREFVPFAETEDLFSRALTFVNTSTAEGFPNTFIQAARVGTPILSLTVDPDGLLGRADIGSAAGDDMGLLGRRLDELLDQPETWQRQSENAYRYFAEQHNLATSLPAFAERLRDLASTRTRSRSAR
ncbi:glycosyltransferase family 4 protein [Micromonospora sp. DT43]|uniref:glycosyltransferase family 4 protein n=1 Tax=Micromonospora sp. DT43 TaxID=3393440 RepID=UPI003CF45E3D